MVVDLLALSLKSPSLGIVYFWYVPLMICMTLFTLSIVHTMGYVVADGKSNWLEGAILICNVASPANHRIWLNKSFIGLYVIIAVSFFFYPGKI